MNLSETSATHKYNVDTVEDDNIKLDSSGLYEDIFKMCPLLAKCKDVEGVAVDGQLKTEDTNLAGSLTNAKEGISVKYKIKVKIFVSGMMETVVSGEVDFDLCHFGKVGTPRVKQLQNSK